MDIAEFELNDHAIFSGFEHYWFTVPVSYLENRYDDPESAEVEIFFPEETAECDIPKLAEVQISPVSEIDGTTTSFDWNPFELDRDFIMNLIQNAKKLNRNTMAEVGNSLMPEAELHDALAYQYGYDSYSAMQENLAKKAEHGKKVSVLREKGSVKIRDIKELLKFTLDERDEVVICDDHENFYLPISFDADKTFDWNLDVESSEDWINLYLNVYPDATSYNIKLVLEYNDNTTSGKDFDLDVEMTNEQVKMFKKRFDMLMEKTYGMSLLEMWAQDTRID